MFEIYLVPNEELDGTEEYLDERKTRSEAIEKAEELRCEKSGEIWVVEANDDDGYVRVVATQVK